LESWKRYVLDAVWQRPASTQPFFHDKIARIWANFSYTKQGDGWRMVRTGIIRCASGRQVLVCRVLHSLGPGLGGLGERHRGTAASSRLNKRGARLMSVFFLQALNINYAR